VIVRFVGISGIVDHHFLNFLSIKKNTTEGSPFIKLDKTSYSKDAAYLVEVN
jgi:hypothetical protein